MFEDMVLQLATRYESLVNFMRAAVIKVRGDCTIMFANTYATELFGFSNTELVGSHLKLIMPQEKHAHLQEQVDSIQEKEIRINQVAQNVTKSGGKIWIAWSNRVMTPGQGKSREMLFVGNDVTEEVKNKEQLRETEQFFRSVLELAPDGSMVADAHGKSGWPMRAVRNCSAILAKRSSGSPWKCLCPQRYVRGTLHCARAFIRFPWSAKWVRDANCVPNEKMGANFWWKLA